MKTSFETVEQLDDSMRREADLLKKFALNGSRIMEDLTDMNWKDLQIHLTVSQNLSKIIENLEFERNRLYQKFCSETDAVESANFYQVVEQSPEAIRISLISQFRELKLALLQAQGMNWKIETYVASAGGTMKEFLNRMFPHRKGTMYSKEGVIREADNNPLVLNREL